MVFSSSQIVWTPFFGQNSLGVALQSAFASACAQYRGDDIGRLIDGAWRLMGSTSPIMPTHFIQMERGILPKGFYSGREGLWLCASRPDIHPVRPHLYHAHNEDRHTYDQVWLLRAFGAWAAGAMVLLNWE